MHSKFILLLLLLGLFLLVSGYYLTQKNSADTVMLDSPTSLATSSQNTNTLNSAAIEPQANKVNNTTKLNNQTTETTEWLTAVYDSDPVVDANTIINQHKVCIRQLADDENNRYYQSLQRNLSKTQRQYLQKLNKHCQQINLQHPEYNLTNLQKLQNQRSSAIATSQWGKIINGEIQPADLTTDEIENLLQQNSTVVLSEAPRYLYKYYQEVIHWDLEDVLQSHQYDYVKQIKNYTHQLYLCNIGSDCGPQSNIMYLLCFYEERACNLNYTEYINNLLTQGQQADIQLALQYLHTKYINKN
ncbi:MAG: hypothetical protein L3J53_00850 [Proteobacteria bacterium]|nr:hypothetical protein [Pseudomonadota bacterium]